MPTITIFIDSKVVSEVNKLVEKRLINSLADAVQISLLLLVKVIKECEKRNIKIEDCFEKCIDFILS